MTNKEGGQPAEIPSVDIVKDLQRQLLAADDLPPDFVTEGGLNDDLIAGVTRLESLAMVPFFGGPFGSPTVQSQATSSSSVGQTAKSFGTSLAKRGVKAIVGASARHFLHRQERILDEILLFDRATVERIRALEQRVTQLEDEVRIQTDGA